MTKVLELHNITKRFGALTANDDVTLTLDQGEILALLGENGAGKTTLMNTLFGHYAADEGTVRVFGQELPPGLPRAAIAAGVGMVHQHFTLAGNLTVLENVMLGSEPLTRLTSARGAARKKLMQIADRFGLPVITFVDTPGAYPGKGAEERGQSEAIAKSLELMSSLRTPVVSVVIGEGGSGGALAIGVCDRLLMMEYAVYSVISPEGCASILFKDAARASEAAEAMKITAQDLLQHKLIDEIVEEPLGGAHRDAPALMAALNARLSAAFETLRSMPMTQLAERRHQRLMGFGAFELVAA